MVTTTSLRDSLIDGAKEVLETMVFMAIEEIDDESPEMEDLTLLGTITFKGNLEGCLGFCCGYTCARTIAANMLGMDPTDEISEEDVNDAVGEVVNMVMGAVKSRVQDDVGTMEVSIPSVVQGRELKNSLGDKASGFAVSASIEAEHNVRLSLLYRETEPDL